jgi:pimeloyl-ACP methyl ester carboxylesterase
VRAGLRAQPSLQVRRRGLGSWPSLLPQKRMNQRPEEQTVIVEGLELALRVWGPEDGTPVLALHGWLDNAGTWDGLAPLLPGIRLVALDFPGHGHSMHRAASGDYAFISWLPIVHGVLDALGWTTACLLGHSMGGGVAALYAGAQSKRVERLVLVEGLGPLASEAADAPERLSRALLQRAAPPRRPRVLPSIAEAKARRSAASPAFGEFALNAIVSRGVAHVSGGVAFTHDVRLRHASLLRMTEAQVLAVLSEVSCPTLVVRARDGLAFPPELARARIEALGDVRVVEVPGDHHVHLTDASCLVEAVGDLLGGR